MLACTARAGKRGLTVYRTTRDMLVEELGLEPSPALQQLEQAILRADPALLQPVSVQVGVPHQEPGSRAGPCQLPPDIDDFAGREAAVAKVQELLEGDLATAIVISAIGGKAGVGKTALAVRVAHGCGRASRRAAACEPSRPRPRRWTLPTYSPDSSAPSARRQGGR